MSIHLNKKVKRNKFSTLILYSIFILIEPFLFLFIKIYLYHLKLALLKFAHYTITLKLHISFSKRLYLNPLAASQKFHLLHRNILFYIREFCISNSFNILQFFYFSKFSILLSIFYNPTCN